MKKGSKIGRDVKVASVVLEGSFDLPLDLNGGSDKFNEYSDWFTTFLDATHSSLLKNTRTLPWKVQSPSDSCCTYFAYRLLCAGATGYGVMFPLPKHVSVAHAVFHSAIIIALVFLRFYPGPDYSRSICTVLLGFLTFFPRRIYNIRLVILLLTRQRLFLPDTTANTFDVHRLALGWFETWTQWCYWASLFYNGYAAIVDFLLESRWRRHRDTFFALVFSAQLATLVGYWAIQVPVEVGVGYGVPSHSTWELIMEHYISPTVPPVLAIIEFLLISHRPGPFLVEFILVSVFCVGFVVTDIVRHSLTKRYIYPIQEKSYGAYWIILVLLVVLAFLAYRGVSRLLLKCRKDSKLFQDILYDSDQDEDSVESRRRLINEDLGSTIRYGRLDGRQQDSCLSLSMPAISMYVIIQTIVMCFLINYLIRERAASRTTPN